MKKVAATSGQRVSLAILFVEGSAREGNWAGRDKVLNCLSRPPSAFLALSQPRMRSDFAKCRIRKNFSDAREICMGGEDFFGGTCVCRAENDERD
jgi:hypothetical protein